MRPRCDKGLSTASYGETRKPFSCRSIITAVVRRISEWNRVAAGIRREDVLGSVPTEPHLDSAEDYATTLSSPSETFDGGVEVSMRTCDVNVR